MLEMLAFNKKSLHSMKIIILLLILFSKANTS